MGESKAPIPLRLGVVEMIPLDLGQLPQSGLDLGFRAFVRLAEVVELEHVAVGCKFFEDRAVGDGVFQVAQRPERARVEFHCLDRFGDFEFGHRPILRCMLSFRTRSIALGEVRLIRPGCGREACLIGSLPIDHSVYSPP